MYVEELQLLEMQNYTQLSFNEAGISVISRGDIYALLHILGSAERDIIALLQGFKSESQDVAQAWGQC